jgi:NAD(P)-dependent dehydrogenase (short-subunit alcohol dehydrogenase family)
MVSFDLTGQVALITGSTKGIGMGIVRQFAAAGAKVVLSSRNQAECDAAATALASEYGRPDFLGLACDMSQPDTIHGVVDAVLANFGRIDALVLNAADTGTPADVADVDLARFTRLLNLNIVSNFELARTVGAAMIGQGSGSITFITSIAASTPMPTNVPYAAAKAAVTSMSKSMANAYIAAGIRVNCVAPGLIRSDSSRVLWEHPEILDAYVDKVVPMKRIGEAEEIGAACVYLASSAGAYVTAAVIPVDGGRAGLGAITGDNIKYGDATGHN